MWPPKLELHSLYATRIWLNPGIWGRKPMKTAWHRTPRLRAKYTIVEPGY